MIRQRLLSTSIPTSRSIPTPILFGLALIALLQACSQHPEIRHNPSLNMEPPPKQWTLKAKLGLKTKDTSGSVTLQWKQQDQNYQIHLQAAFGQGAASLHGNSKHIVIKRPGKAEQASDNVTDLMERNFGWSLPMENLSYWVRGMTNPNLPIEKQAYDEQGSLILLEQSGWTLKYRRYQQVEQWRLPDKIQATFKDTRLNLIIRDWDLDKTRAD